MHRESQIRRFEQALAVLREQFPGLRIESVPASGGLDAAAEIPRQNGLDFDVSINLQNFDELHLNASNFWVEWFPCDEEEVFSRFIEACVSLLSGRGRLVESYLGDRAVSSRLEVPLENGSWRGLATWSNLFAFIPWRRRVVLVQNRPRA
ncbi:MAG: hypothetical protein U0X73_17490 [Thermoanaerobaculia bacterium]